MAQPPLPVHDKSFSYQTRFLADPGNGVSHPRASPSKLILLLRPGGRESWRDEAWYFYTAQLLHYGLPFTQVKDDAKTCLWDALEDYTLEVPARILRLETKLRTRWQENVHRAEEQTAAPVTGNGSPGASGSDTASGSSGTDAVVELPLSSQSRDVLTNTSNTSSQPPTSKGNQLDTNTQGSAQTPSQVVHTTHTPAPVPAPTENGEPSPQTAMWNLRRDSKDMNTSATPYQPLPSISDNPTNSHNPYVLLSGPYQCLTNGAAGDWLKGDRFHLTLSYDFTRRRWWAAFSMGAWDGMIQVNPGPLTPDDVHAGRKFPLMWRLRNLRQRRVQEGVNCTGDVVISSEEISVRLFEVLGFGVLEFVGVRLEGLTLYRDLQCEWDVFCTTGSSG
ncbi:hypothetical protein EKO04_006995 [Ascochyta lentis]|uniref:Uncharacterized protein n=1 Tax=Ascochyta lentis TaxID=205686 RepID=A0A8H7J229_9PLEO|nr:hypothetical protein EKO04_006995 [Ascochyta lentis]